MAISSSRRVVIGTVTLMTLLYIQTSARGECEADKTSTRHLAGAAKSCKLVAHTKSPTMLTSCKTVVDKPRSLFGYSTYPEAWTASQESNRPILLYVSMSGCHHCDKMMAESYRQPAMEQMLVKSFETLYVTRNKHPKLVAKLKVKWYPTTVLVGPNNKIMDVIEGYVDRKTLERRLQTSLASSKTSSQTR